ncbi:MAG: GHMP family kinase ATP-binding protein [Chloroflexota bacterium]
MRSATVYVPATCGELVQGTLGGSHFLVSCPIDMYSSVTVELTDDGVWETTPDVPKAVAALELGLARFGLAGVGVRLRIASPIPRSKGMGSSTADVAGTLYALAAALRRVLPAAEVASLALAIEPTNSSLLPNLALLDHRRGRLCEDLGPPPPAEVLVLDSGGEIDTLAYNAVDRSRALLRLAPTHAHALRLVRTGIARSDLSLIGQGATLSALAHQHILPKPHVETALALGQSLGAAGVCVGHSGTVIGVLFPPGVADPRLVQQHFRNDLPGLGILGWQQLVCGGVRYGPSTAPPSRFRTADDEWPR